MSETQKHTKPNVPNLRFPGFEGEWEEYINENLFSISKEKNKSLEYHTVLSASQTEGMVERDSLGIDIKYEAESVSGYKVVRPGEYVIHLRSFQGGFAFSDTTGICSPAYTILHPKEVLSYSFLREYFMSRKFIDSLRLVTYGIRDGKSISIEEWMKLKTYIPKSLKEQERIKEFLGLIDKRLTIQNKVIERYESLIRAIILRSQSSSSIRIVYLREILNERRELNEHGYDICSVSVSKGVVNQVEYLGRSFAAKETAHYHVVHKGDIVYTKSPTGEFPYGIIKQSYLDTPVAVSPLYGVYEPIDYLTGVYLHHFFCSPQNAKNYLHKLIQKGAKNTINITNQHFLDNLISIPGSDALKRIVALIEILSTKVDLERELLSIYSKQKAFLLFSLFI